MNSDLQARQMTIAGPPAWRSGDRRIQRGLLLVMAWLAVFAAPNAHAQSSPEYDLDSLVYLSGNIVEGEIVKINGGNQPTADVRVTNILSGALKVDQIISVEGLNRFLKRPSQSSTGQVPLEPGDKLIIFLPGGAAQAGGNGTESLPPLRPVGNGLKLVHGDQVRGFFQNMNPGPYVARILPPSDNSTGETLAHFREAISASIRLCAERRTSLSKPTTPEDCPGLLAILQARTQSHGWGNDLISQTIVTQLISAGNNDVLYQTMSIFPPATGVAGFTSRFANLDGYEFLRTKLFDESQPQELRLGLVELLRILSYDLSLAEKIPSQLTNMARMAANIKTERVAIALTDSLESRWSKRSGGSAPSADDADAAAAVLTKLYKDTASERLRFAIEMALERKSPADFSQLGKPDAPVLAFISLSDKKQTGVLVPGHLTFSYEINWVKASGSIDRIVLVFQPDSGEPFTLPFPGDGLKYGGGSSGGIQTVRLPTDLKAGHYRIFIRFLSGDKIVAESHFAEIKL